MEVGSTKIEGAVGYGNKLDKATGCGFEVRHRDCRSKLAKAALRRRAESGKEAEGERGRSEDGRGGVG